MYTDLKSWVGDKDVCLTIAGICVTVIASIFVLGDVGSILVERFRDSDWPGVFEQICFVAIIYFLIYGNLVYHATRIGFLIRHRRHIPARQSELDKLYRISPPRLAVLVPAYKEEPAVVLQTLLSAALLDYPEKRVVLLIDDPPRPTSPADARNLKAMRQLTGRVESLLSEPAVLFRNELKQYLRRCAAGRCSVRKELVRLAGLFDQAAQYIANIESELSVHDHVGAFFIEHTLHTPGERLRRHADKLRRLSADACQRITSDSLVSDYRRLAGRFNARIFSFERKLFDNLSHEPNKAMNLNSYIGLLGKQVREVNHSDRRRKRLVRVATEGIEKFRDVDYLITLDADSLLMSDYALRLVVFMERAENARVAIAQTPYSTFPNAPRIIERVAGITTDIQHIIHQGFTHFDATYWVGANALIRRKALDDIATFEKEGDKMIVKFIQDRTVIEDTESSVDLLLKGWTLYNYPDRLAYSATPPDFGALLIQRRRWANGGLIILPKLLKYLFRRSWSPSRLVKGLIQAHYLTSLAGVSGGVLLLILYPFEESMHSWWLPLTALPYFLLYGLDMRRLGYKWFDLLRVYALNLLLIPVNLGGVIKSLQQAVSGRKTPFGRTPKVKSRTAAPSLYVLWVVSLFVYCLGNSVVDLAFERWVHAAFAFINGLFFGYAIVALVGLNEFAEDLLTPILERLRQENRLRVEQKWRRTADHHAASSSGIDLGEPVPARRYALRFLAGLFSSIIN
jgi:cellulose synthase/poly-beta-1,6-N-acetylglucosamine synthase-like glycosyltransferase